MSDSLKQAVEAMEVAWRRLREVLDGPDVAAALVERQAVRPMSTAPRDGSSVNLHFVGEATIKGWWDRGVWKEGPGLGGYAGLAFIGWSPVK